MSSSFYVLEIPFIKEKEKNVTVQGASGKSQRELRFKTS